MPAETPGEISSNVPDDDESVFLRTIDSNPQVIETADCVTRDEPTQCMPSRSRRNTTSPCDQGSRSKAPNGTPAPDKRCCRRIDGGDECTEPIRPTLDRSMQERGLRPQKRAAGDETAFQAER